MTTFVDEFHHVPSAMLDLFIVHIVLKFALNVSCGRKAWNGPRHLLGFLRIQYAIDMHCCVDNAYL